MTLLQEASPQRQIELQSTALLAGTCFHMVSDSVKATLRHQSFSVPRLARIFARRRKFINRVLAFEFPGRVKLPLAA